MSEVIESKLADGARLERWNHREIGLSPAELKLLYQRRDALGLIYFGGWLCLTGGAGFLYYLSFATYWVVPALMLYGTILALAYAMSHETAHGTAFRTRWLNEAVFWFTSFIYGQEPNYRRYSHATHHAYTGMHGLDAQMPWQHPMTLGIYLKKISGYSEIVGFPTVWIRHALGDIPDRVKEFTPEKKWPRLIWGARLFLGAHAALIAGFAVAGVWWIPFVFFYGPRLVGGPLATNVFDITQHGEMNEEVLDMRENTRSVKTNRLTNFVYSNMSHHLEHHLYPLVPFHALPALNRRIRDQLPEPGPGFYRTNLRILCTIFTRMRGSEPREEVS